MTWIQVSDLRDLLLEVAAELRANGVRIGTGEIVEAWRIARDYALLQRKTGLERSELASLLVSVWPLAAEKRDLVEEALERAGRSANFEERAARIYEEIMENVSNLGVKPGYRFSLKSAIRSARKGRARARIKASYYRLKRIGAITGRSGSERLADPARLRSIAYSLARAGYESIDDAIASMRAPRSRDDVLLQIESRLPFTREQLESMSESRLLRTGWDALRKHDRRTIEAVASVLRERILRGDPIRDPGDAVEFLRRAHQLSSEILVSLLARGEPVEGVSLDTIARVVSSLDDETGGMLLSRYRRILGEEDYARLLSMVDPRKLWRLTEGRSLPGREGDAVRAVASAARAYREALEYARTLDPARADMSSYYAQKARALAGSLGRGETILDTSVALELADAAERLVAAIEGFGRGVTVRDMAEALAGLDLEDAVIVLKRLYATAQSREERALIVRSMEKILSRATSRSGLVPVERWRVTSRGGRLEVRRTTYRLIRNVPDPLVFRSRLRTSMVGLGLDISSSMISYSSWALAVASMFSRHLERIVFFSHRVEAYNGPFTRREMARLLLEQEFGGRTNISAALRALGEKLRGKRVVVVSDLSQTVDDEPPWRVVASLARRGVRVFFITHERHDRDARRLIERERGRVIVARTPREAARRIVNLLR